MTETEYDDGRRDSLKKAIRIYSNSWIHDHDWIAEPHGPEIEYGKLRLYPALREYGAPDLLTKGFILSRTPLLWIASSDGYSEIDYFNPRAFRSASHLEKYLDDVEEDYLEYLDDKDG